MYVSVDISVGNIGALWRCYLSNDCAPRSPRERGRPEIASRRGNRDSAAGSPRSSSPLAVAAA